MQIGAYESHTEIERIEECVLVTMYSKVYMRVEIRMNEDDKDENKDVIESERSDSEGG